MRLDYDRFKDILSRNPLHNVIIWFGLRHSEKWRGMQRHLMRRCELEFEHSSCEAASLFYDQAIVTLALYLEAISTLAIGQYPLFGSIGRRLLARLDWLIIASHVMADAFYVDLFGWDNEDVD